MARVKGRDVMLDLMDAVAKLESLASAQADEFEALTGKVTVLADNVAVLANNVVALTQGFGRTSSTVRSSEQQLKRVARLLVELAGDHQRIEVLEERVEKLERKAG